MSKKVLARVDASLLAVLLIALIAALPLVTRPGLPRHTDLELHVFRAAEFERLLAERPLEHPRWAPNFYYGYGYPIFNYYAPLTYYAVGAIALVPVLDIVDAMKIVLVLTFVSAACGAFFFARRHFGGASGVVAAAAYVLSPYVLFVDPFMRGDAAEFLALGILPWVFLAFDRPLSSARDIARAALALAALVLSHNLMALIGAGLLAAWLAWRGVFVDGAGRWLRDVAAVALAAGLTAVFWLPFFAERSAVRLDVAGPGHFDFRNHFVELGTLLRPSPVLDLGATAPHFIYNLGFAQWLLALPAPLAILRRRSQPAARIAAFFVLASLALIFLMMPASQAWWEAVPPAALIQFPWRFLGLAAFALAMCAGCTVSTFRRAEIAAAVALSLVLLTALPAMYPPSWDAEFGDTSPRGAVEFELSGIALGTTSTGDFLPRTFAETPPPAQPLIDAYRTGGAVDRFDYASAAGARVRRSLVRIGDLDAEYDVESSDDFTARFFIFAFPGWRAYVDGKPVPLRPSGGDGFILFDVPASAHTFGVRFESTAPRTAGAIVTLGSLLVAAAIVAVSRLRKSPASADLMAGPSVQRSPRSAIRLLVPLLAAFLAVKVLIVDRCDTCFRYTSPPGQA
ncbi:MAG TPA: 6-pyruvoyl-tetrahydropterin synthase-related protein, partial [Anaerolineae bacterium]|nr:6-pyruvoyl-tetrahydropterin synthase-related protein [Anaerolineae bacterium]